MTTPLPRGQSTQLIEAYPHHAEADSFDLRKTWLGLKQAILGHRRLILLTSVLTTLMVVAYVAVWPPMYASSVLVAGESDRDSSRDEFYQAWNVFRKDRLVDEANLMTTGPVLKEVIERLKLTDDEVHHTFFAYATKLWTESLPGKAWRGTKEILFGKKKGAFVLTPEQIDKAKTLTNFKSGVSFETIADANVGSITVVGPTPRVAEMADTLAEVYLAQRRSRHQSEADNAYKALAGEAAKAEAELLTLEQRMADYYSANGLVLMFEKDKLDINQWSVLRAAITEHQTAIASMGSTLSQVNAQLGSENREVVSGRVMKTSAAREALTDRLSQLELSRKQLLIHYRPDAPEVEELDRQIGVVKEQLAAEPREVVQTSSVVLNEAYETLRQRKRQLEADVAGQRAALAVKQTQANAIRKVMDAIPEKMKVTHDFDREHAALEKRYVTLQEKMMVAAVSRAAAASAPPTIRIVENASVPEKPVWPKTKLLIPGAALVGLGAGIFLALLLDLLNGRVNRYRLPSGDGAMPVYALISHDRRAAAELFAPTAAPAITYETRG